MNEKFIDLSLWTAILACSLGDALLLPFYLIDHDDLTYTIILFVLFIISCAAIFVQIRRKKAWFWFIFAAILLILFLFCFFSINGNSTISNYHGDYNGFYYGGSYYESDSPSLQQALFLNRQYWVLISLCLILPSIYVVSQLYQQNKRCPACNRPVRGKEKFCTQCGIRLSYTSQQNSPQMPKNCPSCNTKLRKYEKFCSSCGTRITVIAPTTVTFYSCHSCKSSYLPTDTFCGTCGSALAPTNSGKTVMKENESIPNKN